jgi:hypothetical protein
MEARGFGAAVAPPSPRQAVADQAGLLGSLLGLLVGLGLAAYQPDLASWGWALAGASALGLAATFYLQGRRVRQTRYRRLPWHPRDLALVAACLLVVAAIVATRMVAPEAVFYSPYPPNALLPPFHPLAGAALLLLALPALLAPGHTEVQRDTL